MDIAGKLRQMAERERAGGSKGDGSRDYYDGVADGLIMAAELAEKLAQPIVAPDERHEHR